MDLGLRRHLAAHLLLHAPILFYAALFFAGRETAAAIAQKPALLAIAAVLLSSARKANGRRRITHPTHLPVPA